MNRFFRLKAYRNLEKAWRHYGQIALVLLMLALLQVPTAVIANTIPFKPAYHKDFHGQVKTQDGKPAVQFEPFEAINWKAVAHKHFKAYPLDVDQISEAQLKALTKISVFGYASIPFTAPAPVSVIRQRMIFLSADGSREVVVRELKGVVRYKFDRDGEQIIAINFFGYVLAAPKPNNVLSGGFVGRLSINQELVRERRVNLGLETLARINPFQKLKIKRQTEYGFQGSEKSYLVLEYDSDQTCDYGCCEYRYVLFERRTESDHFNQISGCAYECDV